MARDRSLLYALSPKSESHLLPFRVSPFKGSSVRRVEFGLITIV